MKYEDLHNIRELLGNRYHFHEEYDENLNLVRWVLFRNYDDMRIFLSPDNKAIMSSEKNTLKDLYDYAKTHHVIDEHRFMSIFGIYYSIFALLLTFINIIFLNNDTLRGFIYGIDLTVILYCSISHKIWNKNWKIKTFELKENFIRNHKNDE